MQGDPGVYQGIKLHVDYGPYAPLLWGEGTMNAKPALWGAKSRASEILGNPILVTSIFVLLILMPTLGIGVKN